MPTQFMGAGDLRIMALVGAPATWNRHGKAWLEWVRLAGDDLNRGRDRLLEITLNYLVQLREQGASATVAQRRLSGIRLHVLLRGWEDVTKDFIIRQEREH